MAAISLRLAMRVVIAVLRVGNRGEYFIQLHHAVTTLYTFGWFMFLCFKQTSSMIQRTVAGAIHSLAWMPESMKIAGSAVLPAFIW